MAEDRSAAQGQHEDCDERIARLRAAATDVRLRDAQTVGDLLDDAREALEAAYVLLGGRGVFTCPVCGTSWQDADEKPSSKGIPVNLRGR